MAEEYKVRVTPYAMGQLHEIGRYIASTLQAPDTAKRWLDRVKNELASLSYFPARVPLTDEEPWRSQGIHKLVIKNHLAYFWIDEKSRTVYVTAVVYAKRSQREQLLLME